MVKVLLVSHNYPPAHTAGTEQYTAQLAAGLRDRGHGVCVFTTEKDIRRRHLSLHQREHQGVVVHELMNNLHYGEFRESWDHKAIAELFGEFLQREKPDLVHFNHLLYLSIGCAEAAKELGIAVVFTCHDYWLQCARFGQRVAPDGSLCHDIDEQRCAECLGSFRFRNSALEQRAGPWIERVQRLAGIDLAAPARRAGDWLRGQEKDQATVPLAIEAVQERARELTGRLVACVDRFLSPSDFLRRELVAWGVPSERFEHLRTGTDLELFGGGERVPRGDRLRVGFIGSLIAVKGAHLLLEAVATMAQGQRDRMQVQVFGPSFHDGAYQDSLEKKATQLGVEMGGSLDREGVARTLRRLDLLVVPSLWFENQPLIILEALAAQTPLAVSDIGGMAELVQPGVGGYRFPVGDAGALASLLGELLENPGALEELFNEPVAIPSTGDQLDGIERVYHEVLGESR